MALNHCM